jgi:hypothetical protein
MTNYNLRYRELITDSATILPSKMLRSQFYRVREYVDKDGVKKSYQEYDAPIIFTLYVSRPKNVVHAIKLSVIKPETAQKFFGRFVNESIATIVFKGTSKTIYQTIINKMPFVTEEAYRVYKLSGLKRIEQLDMFLPKLTPRDEPADDLDDYEVKRSLERDDFSS